MKTLHIHIKVADLAKSEKFYTGLFGMAPTKVKPNYMKWDLENPRVNFSIADTPGKPGIRHLGIQVDSPEELQEAYTNMDVAGGDILEEGHTTCCYAQSEKSWITDPTGIEWEVFRTYGESEKYRDEKDDACCASDCCTE